MYLISKFISSVCPFTFGAIGSIISLLTLLARYAFIILVFIFAPKWWDGLFLIAAEFIMLLLLPRINPYEMSPKAICLSKIVSLISPICMVVAYLTLF